ncbi:MAG: T9SS type A sorting domain-containing protein, partial [Bacteroidales bacterium]|nr:T9SS type A sorting domain-containing protein [Bacteroidales bacterium]
FNGDGPQYVGSEHFNILELDKPDDNLFSSNNNHIICDVYDWTNGCLWIQNGTFVANDLADDGIYGGFVLGETFTWEYIYLHQDVSQSIDLHGSITIHGGEFRVYGGKDQSLWGTHANANVSMNTGVLDFVDQGIAIQDVAPFSFTSTISGGTIRTQKGFTVQSPGFNPTGGTVELYGAQNSGISTATGGAFYNVNINKPSNFSTSVRIWSSVVKNNFMVVEGFAEVGFGDKLTCWSNLEIQDGGWLGVNSGTIAMKHLSSVNVNANGYLSLSGYEEAKSRVKGIVPTEQYTISINNGGMLDATFTIFEDLPEQGVYIAPGATVNPAYSFTNCEFRNGMSGPTTLLSIESGQDIVIENAVFPTNAWGGQYNVRKEVDAGSVTFVNATGGFAGEAFENDPFNRVFWSNVPVNLEVNNLIIDYGVILCFNAQQTITVADFVVENGGSATFIAGNKISFLPGTTVKPGGYMNAYITTTNEYCINLDASMVTIASGEEELKLLPEQESQRYSIYPNPTTGNFTLLHKGDFLPGNVQVEIFNMQGEKICSTSYKAERKHDFTLSGVAAGLCFVKIMAGDYVESLKLVITQ